MNLQQLRIIHAALSHHFNLTEVASTLATSQSGISRHIKDLEDELGVEIFHRHGKRLLGLTEPGEQIASHVQRIITEIANIKSAADHLVTFPYHSWHHCVVVPRGHELVGDARAGNGLTGDVAAQLKILMTYPIITYHDGLTGRGKIDAAFASVGVTPNIVMEALDADVIKAYVALGMGIGIISSLAFNRMLDSSLVALPSAKLFEESTSHLAIRRQRRLRGFAYAFLALCRPDLSEAVVKKRLAEE